jgi:hypothetical protein
VEHEAVLLTHAEVAVALAGFASVVAALRRPLTPVDRQRFLALLFLALVQVLGCLGPIWLDSFVVNPAVLWRSSSLIILVLAAFHYVFLVFRPLRRIEASFELINPAVSVITRCVVALYFLGLLFNTLGVPFAPGFPLYYFALTAGLGLGFAVFADVVVGRSADA